MEKEILKFLKREIIKSAKKGNLYYYWNITGLNQYLVKNIIIELEKDGKNVKSKGEFFKIIMW